MSDVVTRAKDAAVARTERPSIQNEIRSMSGQFALALPSGMSADRLVRDALTCFSTTPALARCDRTSILGGLMTCAQLGLRPGVLGQAWLIPFGNRAQLIIGYQGLIDLAHRSGVIRSLIAREVHENDEFSIEYGLDDNLIHRPATGDRGPVTGYYAVAKFTTGGHAFEHMTAAEAAAHRDKFAMSKKGPWSDHFDAMAKKTVVKKVLRWAPRSTEIGAALAADNTVRVDYAPDADVPTVVEYAEAVEDTEATVDAAPDTVPSE